jgi:hypothetical protein
LNDSNRPTVSYDASNAQKLRISVSTIVVLADACSVAPSRIRFPPPLRTAFAATWSPASN